MRNAVKLRKIHKWVSIIIAIPAVISICTGLLLLVKKQIGWIQPPTQQGIAPNRMPEISLAKLFTIAKQVKQANLSNWKDLRRVDYKITKGIAKFVSKNLHEIQIDTNTGKLLQVAYRRSDRIEDLHDGSFFADWFKLGIWLPSGLGLLILWITGILLFAHRANISKGPFFGLQKKNEKDQHD